MTYLAVDLAEEGFTLRSGGANGSDRAFELGCVQAHGRMEIYLPWKKFNKNISPLFSVSDEAMQLASTVHPAWNKCSDAAKKLHGRNCYQVLGRYLNNPSDFVVCYTEGGEIKGGTATAINLALRHNVPVFNLGSMNIEEVRKQIWNTLERLQNNVAYKQYYEEGIGINYDDVDPTDDDPTNGSWDELRPY